jgi:hypothetical protein
MIPSFPGPGSVSSRPSVAQITPVRDLSKEIIERLRSRVLVKIPRREPKDPATA